MSNIGTAVFNIQHEIWNIFKLQNTIITVELTQANAAYFNITQFKG